ncbi:hypothetical protein BDD26_1940 [Xenorhabdus cabanillasii]|uniref:Uncharacterized protein n=1 Tax=Xenorhabdus cabanillasii TaxID=351673 RepID=A0A3D9UFN4_9GAMM|nr:hypothetical protein BDD26_1940 [Xenorhabdus cabanillasii]
MLDLRSDRDSHSGVGVGQIPASLAHKDRRLAPV